MALASGRERPGALPLGQAATLYRIKLGPGESTSHDLAPGRRGYLFVIGGAVTLGDVLLEPGDSARAEDEARLAVKAGRATDLLLLDLP
jgi:redox-sensitive bicupin YhaK (pirin superfamily)